MAFINNKLNPFKAGRNPYRNIVFESEFEPEIEEQLKSPYRNMLDNLDMDTPALKAYQEHILGMPSRGDYKPSIWRRIAGAAIGGISGASNPIAGARLAEQIVNSPYERALEDWGNKATGLKTVADIEGRNEGRRGNLINAILDFESSGMADKTRNRKIDVDTERANKEISIKEFDSETRRKQVELTEKRDKAVDEREKKRINAQIENWKQTRANERTRIASQEKASLARTEAYKNRPAGNNTRTRYNDPTKIKQSELAAAQELFNTGEYEDVKEYLTPGPNGIQVNIPKDGYFKKYDKVRKRAQDFIKEMKKRALARYTSEFGSSPYVDEDDEFELEEQ